MCAVGYVSRGHFWRLRLYVWACAILLAHTIACLRVCVHVFLFVFPHTFQSRLSLRG